MVFEACLVVMAITSIINTVAILLPRKGDPRDRVIACLEAQSTALFEQVKLANLRALEATVVHRDEPSARMFVGYRGQADRAVAIASELDARREAEAEQPAADTDPRNEVGMLGGFDEE